MFRARLPSIFTTVVYYMSQTAMPVCHGICTLSPPHAAQTMRFAKKHAKCQWKSPNSCICHGTWKSSSANDARVLRLSERLLTGCETCWNVTKCHTCHAKRGSHRFKPQVTTFAALPIGTAIATSSQTVAEGCKRLPTVVTTKAALSEHVSTPRPPK